MSSGFEQRAADVAGRLGRLEVPRAGVTVETPVLLPVVNPHVQTISPARLADEFGARALITNAYILHGSDALREEVLDSGLHDLLGFDGAIMTDSGAFQLAEYGEIDVSTEEILAFQRDIGSDIATPVDIPTPPDVERDRAGADLAETLGRLEITADFDAGDMLLSAPVQGSTFPDLRERAGREARATGLDLFPVGGMVPLLKDYRFTDVVEAVVAAKRGLDVDAPVHLFGAGHPMVFALAAAMGCDLFDSAAYALYANDDRYLTVRGTERLDALRELPCGCPVCSTWSADGLRAADATERRDALAAHNLHVSFAELRRVRQAIRDGDLVELVETRARAHPAVLDGYRALLDHADWLERHDPASKGTFFHLSAESAHRPEVLRHRNRLERLVVPGRLLLLEGSFDAVEGRLDPAAFDEIWELRPPFGPLPPDLAETYPLTAEVPERVDDESRLAAAAAITRLSELRPDATLVVAHRGWPERMLEDLPPDVTALDLEV